MVQRALGWIHCEIQRTGGIKRWSGNRNNCPNQHAIDPIFSRQRSGQTVHDIHMNSPPMPAAYAIGRTFGWGTASYCVNFGSHVSSKWMKAPLFPIESQ